MNQTALLPLGASAPTRTEAIEVVVELAILVYTCDYPECIFWRGRDAFEAVHHESRLDLHSGQRPRVQHLTVVTR